MKRSLSLMFIILALALVASAQNFVFTKPYETPLFTAKFLVGGPEINDSSKATQEVETKVGTLTEAMYMQINGKVVLSVMYMDAPADTTTDLDNGLTGVFGKLDVESNETEPRFNTSIGRLFARGGGVTGKQTIQGEVTSVTAYIRIAVDNQNTVKRVWLVMYYCTDNVPCSETVANQFFNTVTIK
jgi:hypothetical protein